MFKEDSVSVWSVESINYSPNSPRTRPEGSFTTWGAARSWMIRVGGEFQITKWSPKDHGVLAPVGSDIILSSLLEDEKSSEDPKAVSAVQDRHPDGSQPNGGANAA